MATQQTARTQYIKASNGITFAYRRLGRPNGIPLVLQIHFRANMDFWDPLLVNALAAKRPVILFDQSGVGRSDGKVPDTYAGWADNIARLVEALGLEKIDLLGFSMGGFTVEMAALNSPHLIRKLIICGSGPSPPDPSVRHQDIVWPREPQPEAPFRLLIDSESGNRQAEEESIHVSFFPQTELGRTASTAYFQRIHQRTAETAGGEEPIQSLLGPGGTRGQMVALSEWSKFNPRNSSARLGELRIPVLILNGNDDVLIRTSQSWELLQGIENAQVIIYPQSGHGFIWQYAERVAEDVNRFLEFDLQSSVAKL